MPALKLTAYFEFANTPDEIADRDAELASARRRGDLSKQVLDLATQLLPHLLPPRRDGSSVSSDAQPEPAQAYRATSCDGKGACGACPAGSPPEDILDGSYDEGEPSDIDDCDDGGTCDAGACDGDCEGSGDDDLDEVSTYDEGPRPE